MPRPSLALGAVRTRFPMGHLVWLRSWRRVLDMTVRTVYTMWREVSVMDEAKALVGVHARVPVAVIEALVREAEAKDWSLSHLIRRVLESHVEDSKPVN